MGRPAAGLTGTTGAGLEFPAAATIGLVVVATGAGAAVTGAAETDTVVICGGREPAGQLISGETIHVALGRGAAAGVAGITASSRDSIGRRLNSGSRRTSSPRTNI